MALKSTERVADPNSEPREGRGTKGDPRQGGKNRQGAQHPGEKAETKRNEVAKMVRAYRR